MIVKNIICDNCMSDITRIEHESAFGYDFCPDCYPKMKEGFDAFLGKSRNEELEKIENELEAENQRILREQRNPEIEKIRKVQRREKPEASCKEKIDWDKACALKIAGWSNKAIAEELKLNEGTVNSTIYKKVEEYKKGVRMNKVAEPKEEKEEKCPFD